MDLEQAKTIAESQGYDLLGFHTIPVPVYKVIVSYDSYDNDPFFPLQKALLRIIDEIGSNVDDKFAAALLGVDEQLMKQTRKKLEDNHFIIPDPITGEKKLTDDARRKYLDYGARPTVNITGSFFVDGKSLDFLPDNAAKQRLYAHKIYDEEDVSTHKPIIFAEHPIETQKIENKLNNNKVSLEYLNLDKDGRNFKVTEIERLMLANVYLLYFHAKDSTIKKQAYIDDKVFKTPATGNVDTYTFRLKQDDKGHCRVARNLGYNANDETKDRYIDEPADKDVRWEDVVKEAYGIKTQYTPQIEYDQEAGLYFLKVTREMVDASNNPRKIINDCSKMRPCLNLQLPQGESGILLFDIIPEMGYYLNLAQALQDIGNLDKENLDASELVKKLAGISPQWRNDLLSMGYEQELEKIDFKRFIHSL